MKSKFEFAFVCKQIDFRGTKLFRGRVGVQFEPRVPPSPPPRAPMEALVEILVTPSSEARFDRFPDGNLYITLPGPPEEMEWLAYRLAEDFAALINFTHGPVFKLSLGLVSAERISETPEEEAQLGEGRHWARVTLEEVPKPVPFDNSTFDLFPATILSRRLIAQFNEAADDTNPIDQFLGFFKVLETCYAEGRGRLRDRLYRQKEFFRMIKEKALKVDGETRRPLSDDEIRDLIKQMVGIRDKSAHFKEDFGYSPVDPEVAEEVRPFLSLVRGLAWDTVFRRLQQSPESPR